MPVFKSCFGGLAGPMKHTNITKGRFRGVTTGWVLYSKVTALNAVHTRPWKLDFYPEPWIQTGHYNGIHWCIHAFLNMAGPFEIQDGSISSFWIKNYFTRTTHKGNGGNMKRREVITRKIIFPLFPRNTANTYHLKVLMFKWYCSMLRSGWYIWNGVK